ncbi:MAG: PAS domain-containing protein, partial [Verrucomicrobiota bacterium]
MSHAPDNRKETSQRQPAEDKADALAKERLEQLAPEVALKTIHELKVYQVELEAQNRELSHTQQELEAARDKYFSFYDHASIGYLTLSEKDLILEANLKAAELLGVPRSELLRQPFHRFILPDDQARYRQHKKQLWETGAPQQCDLRLLKAGGSEFWVHLQRSAALDPDGTRVCRVILSDITERKQLEEAQSFLLHCWNVRPSEDFFATLARFLAQSLQMDFVCIDRLEGDGLTARTVAVWCDGKFEDNVTYALKDTPCGDVVGKDVCCFPASVCQFFPRDQVLQDLRAESYLSFDTGGIFFEGTMDSLG